MKSKSKPSKPVKTVRRLNAGRLNLEKLVRVSLWDFKPFGTINKRDNDCFSGCKFFIKLNKYQDCGVCVNVKSHRCGLVTLRDQGCLDFVKQKR